MVIGVTGDWSMCRGSRPVSDVRWLMLVSIVHRSALWRTQHSLFDDHVIGDGSRHPPERAEAGSLDFPPVVLQNVHVVVLAAEDRLAAVGKIETTESQCPLSARPSGSGHRDNRVHSVVHVEHGVVALVVRGERDTTEEIAHAVRVGAAVWAVVYLRSAW